MSAVLCLDSAAGDAASTSQMVRGSPRPTSTPQREAREAAAEGEPDPQRGDDEAAIEEEEEHLPPLHARHLGQDRPRSVQKHPREGARERRRPRRREPRVVPHPLDVSLKRREEFDRLEGLEAVEMEKWLRGPGRWLSKQLANLEAPPEPSPRGRKPRPDAGATGS